MARRLAKRRAAERRFRAYGIIAITLAIAALASLFVSIVGNGYTAFQQTYIEIEVDFDPDVLGIGEARDAKALSGANYPGLVKKTMRNMFPEVKGRKAKRALYAVVSSGASFMLREWVLADPALKSVPPSIREAALGMGASKMQTITHHVLPLAMPGMLTGTIIGMAQALGESAPLLMIGMVAFIVDVPGGPLDPSTVLPVQIFLWADSPERAFVERTSAAIMVLLAFLITMNALSVIPRRRFERWW